MKIWKSTKLLNYLRMLYPGKWVYNGKFWVGEEFSVMKVDGIPVRADTGEEIPKPEIKQRSHFIKNILEKKYGGRWEKDRYRIQWRSKEHDFYVYQGTKQGVGRIYRRSDNSEIVFVPNGRKY